MRPHNGKRQKNKSGQVGAQERKKSEPYSLQPSMANTIGNSQNAIIGQFWYILGIQYVRLDHTLGIYGRSTPTGAYWPYAARAQSFSSTLKVVMPSLICCKKFISGKTIGQLLENGDGLY